MQVNVAMVDALHAQADFDAVACVDLQTGAILAASTREEKYRDALELAAQAALQLCAVPSLETSGEAARVRETLVVSAAVVQAVARARTRPDYAIVGLARGGGNVALLLATIRAVADADFEDLP